MNGENYLCGDIDRDLEKIRAMCANTMDLNVMTVEVCGVRCCVLTAEGMVSVSTMSELVFRSLMELRYCNDAEDIFDFLTRKSLLAAERKIVRTYDELFGLVFS